MAIHPLVYTGSGREQHRREVKVLFGVDLQDAPDAQWPERGLVPKLSQNLGGGLEAVQVALMPLVGQKALGRDLRPAHAVKLDEVPRQRPQPLGRRAGLLARGRMAPPRSENGTGGGQSLPAEDLVGGPRAAATARSRVDLPLAGRPVTTT